MVLLHSPLSTSGYFFYYTETCLENSCARKGQGEKEKKNIMNLYPIHYYTLLFTSTSYLQVYFVRIHKIIKYLIIINKTKNTHFCASWRNMGFYYYFLFFCFMLLLIPYLSKISFTTQLENTYSERAELRYCKFSHRVKENFERLNPTPL